MQISAYLIHLFVSLLKTLRLRSDWPKVIYPGLDFAWPFASTHYDWSWSLCWALLTHVYLLFWYLLLLCPVIFLPPLAGGKSVMPFQVSTSVSRYHSSLVSLGFFFSLIIINYFSWFLYDTSVFCLLASSRHTLFCLSKVVPRTKDQFSRTRSQQGKTGTVLLCESRGSALHGYCSMA